ncbi:hypothetical protein [Parvibaculum sp.]|uniref:hypothetical protein n=1 Tax=Parvibaculum sp. TaxID=2024848 RepID=UPI00320DA4F2
MKLLLHIGTAKTGTTTTQEWLSRNRPALKKAGIWYPETGGVNHQWLAILAMDPDKPDDGFYRLGLTDPGKHKSFVERVSEAFAQEYAAASSANFDTAIISSEHLQLRLPSDEMVERVVRFLTRFFTSIEVIIHLRPQTDYTVSIASTASLLGTKVDTAWFDDETKAESPLDYNQLVRRWERAFGEGSVRLVSYKRTPSLVEMLSGRFGIDRTGTANIPNLNTALSVEQIALNNAIQLPQFNDDHATNQNRNIPFLLLPKGNRLSIGLPLARKIQDRFDASNRLLAERRDDIEMDDLTPDWSKYDRPSNLHLLDQDCLFGAELATLVQSFNGYLHLERAMGAISKTQLAATQGNVELARRQLTTAIKESDAAMQIESLRSDAERIKSAAIQTAQSLRL